MTPLIPPDGLEDEYLRQTHLEEIVPAADTTAKRAAYAAKRVIAIGNLDFEIENEDPSMVYLTCMRCLRRYAFSADAMHYDSLYETMRIHRLQECAPRQAGRA